jgi:hypothetical protein
MLPDELLHDGSLRFPFNLRFFKERVQQLLRGGWCRAEPALPGLP